MCKTIKFSVILGLFLVIFLSAVFGASAIEMTPAADKIDLASALPAGFYQFSNLEIFKGSSVDELPTAIEAIQKNEKSCVVYENGKTDLPLSCAFNKNESNNYQIQLEERTTLLGVNQEPALLSDFEAGDKINVLGWLSADSKTIRAAVVKNLATKDFHQSFSGTVKKISADGFVIVSAKGDEIFVKTPIVEGTQVTIKGVFDKANNAVKNVLSILIRPTIVLQEKRTEASQPVTTPSAKPSTLFKNFLKVFGL